MRTRAALGLFAADDLTYLASLNGGMDREWLASLLDWAIAVGHAEAKARAENILGPFVAEMLDREDEMLDMECHMPVYETTNIAGA
jgi:hypothetical protein